MTINAWRQESGTPSLSEVFRTIAVGNGGTSRFRRFLAFIGPGYLVAVGYMDPGNWATSLAGGAAFGYTLLFVALLSNIMAILLQSLCARLAVASGRDLAQACRDAFPKWMSVPLWIFAELAIIATDLAEVIGTAIGLNLLFGIPLEIGIFITAADVFLILWLQNKGFRWIEALIISLHGADRRLFCRADRAGRSGLGRGHRRLCAQAARSSTTRRMLYLALGIIGATVMPHNLYLHSGIVQTRAFGLDLPVQARGAAVGDLGQHHRPDVRADDQCLDPDPGRRCFLHRGAKRRGRDRQGASVCWSRCSARRWRRSCSAWRSSARG